jgi:putative membrane protein
MAVSAEDRERIAQAIRAAEAETSGEIVCVLAQSSSTASGLPVLLAAVGGLVLPWILAALTAMPLVRIALMPRRARRAMAHRAAAEQFMIRGLARKTGRTGVLIFVSLAERYVRIIADEGISARVPQSHWQAAVDAMIAHIRDGRIADGFVRAIELCGGELAKNFPRTDTSRDELPDRIFVI